LTNFRKTLLKGSDTVATLAAKPQRVCCPEECINFIRACPCNTYGAQNNYK